MTDIKDATVCSDFMKYYYGMKQISLPTLFVTVILGGVVSMMTIACLSYFIPAQPLKYARAPCKPYDSKSLVAHIAEGHGSFLVSPMIYGTGTALLGATLFSDASKKEGVFETIEGINASENERCGKIRNAYVLGIIVAMVLMSLGSVNWNAFSNNSEIEDDACRTVEKKSTPPTCWSLLGSDVSLAVAVILNFVGDAFMVSELFEFKKPDQDAVTTKLLVNNAILVGVLAMRARQANASFSTIAQYGGILAGIYILCISMGIVCDRLPSNSVYKKNVKKFNRGFIPVVLMWTLLSHLAPNCFVFQDDSGRQIPASYQLSTNSKYKTKDKNGKLVEKEVGDIASLFNQRDIIISAFTMLVFYTALIVKQK
jgi:hypothetical protein